MKKASNVECTEENTHGQHPPVPDAARRVAARGHRLERVAGSGLRLHAAPPPGATRGHRLPGPDLPRECRSPARCRAGSCQGSRARVRREDRVARPSGRPHEGHAGAAGRDLGRARRRAAGPGVLPRDRQRQDAAQLRADRAQRCGGSQVAGLASEEAGAAMAAVRDGAATAARVGWQRAVAGRRRQDGPPEAGRAVASRVVRMADRQARGRGRAAAAHPGVRTLQARDRAGRGGGGAGRAVPDADRARTVGGPVGASRAQRFVADGAAEPEHIRAPRCVRAAGRCGGDRGEAA